jgi:hypothetical protein
MKNNDNNLSSCQYYQDDNDYREERGGSSQTNNYHRASTSTSAAGSLLNHLQQPSSSAYNYHSIPDVGMSASKNNNSNTHHHPPSAPPAPSNDSNRAAPSYERVERIGSSYNNNNNNNNGNNNDDGADGSKICCICLEDDEPRTMIAPCRCKGSSKWVHRDCLDEWRLHEKDRAFSKCTECLFEYYLQPVYATSSDGNTTTNRNRKFQFCWKVSRDFCVSIALLQLIIIGFATLIWICDTNNALPNQIMTAFSNHPGSLYYLLGWLLLLILTGLYGSGVLCVNGCSISRSLPAVDGNPPSTSRGPTTTTISGARMEDELVRDIGLESNTEFYRRARHRRRRQHHRYYNRNNNDGESCCCCCCCCC